MPVLTPQPTRPLDPMMTMLSPYSRWLPLVLSAELQVNQMLALRERTSAARSSSPFEMEYKARAP